MIRVDESIKVAASWLGQVMLLNPDTRFGTVKAYFYPRKGQLDGDQAVLWRDNDGAVTCLYYHNDDAYSGYFIDGGWFLVPQEQDNISWWENL